MKTAIIQYTDKEGRTRYARISVPSALNPTERREYLRERSQAWSK